MIRVPFSALTNSGRKIYTSVDDDNIERAEFLRALAQCNRYGIEFFHIERSDTDLLIPAPYSALVGRASGVPQGSIMILQWPLGCIKSANASGTSSSDTLRVINPSVCILPESRIRIMNLKSSSV
jgi:hypothetical protein